MRKFHFTLRADWNEYCYLCSVEACKPTVWEFACSYLFPPLLGILCKFRGHRFINDGSYATPESARECFRCARCGKTHKIIYY